MRHRPKAIGIIANNEAAGLLLIAIIAAHAVKTEARGALPIPPICQTFASMRSMSRGLFERVTMRHLKIILDSIATIDLRRGMQALEQ